MKTVKRRWLLSAGAFLLTGCSANPLADATNQPNPTSESTDDSTGPTSDHTENSTTTSDGVTSTQEETTESSNETGSDQEATQTEQTTPGGNLDNSAKTLLPAVEVLPDGYSHQSTQQNNETGVATYVRKYNYTKNGGDDFPEAAAVSVTGFETAEAAQDETENRKQETESRYGDSMEIIHLENGLTYNRLRTVTNGEYLSVHLFTLGGFAIAIVATDSTSYSQDVPLTLTQTVFDRYQARTRISN